MAERGAWFQCGTRVVIRKDVTTSRPQSRACPLRVKLVNVLDTYQKKRGLPSDCHLKQEENNLIQSGENDQDRRDCQRWEPNLGEMPVQVEATGETRKGRGEKKKKTILVIPRPGNYDNAEE